MQDRRSNASSVNLVNLLTHLSLAIAFAEDPISALFENEIRPVLIETCFRCHGDVKASGGLRVDSRDAILKGGDSGPAITLGDSKNSLLIKAIKGHEDVSSMPPVKDKSLRPDQVAAFEKWIEASALWPTTTQKFVRQKHWSYEPVTKPSLPAIRDGAQVTSPIDRFVLAKLETVGETLSPIADKRTLIRRATFDLIGLPPSPSEIDAFLKDVSPQAFNHVVDRLLDTPQYGERWGRHWLDVVRYADTAGETADYPVPLAWRYRNYVIDAFNHDKPYDQFLMEQIAGDILAKQGTLEQYAERVIATGFLALSRRFGFDSENYHHLTIQDTIDTLGQSVLGLSIGCARCHDHKFDAISMKDYYGLYAIFDSSRYAFPGSEQKQKFRSMVPLIPETESHTQWQAFERRVATLVSTVERGKLSAPAAILRSLNEMDGDFEMQAPAAGGSNGVLVSPWLYEGKIAVTNGAQSPYKFLYSGGKAGVSIAGDAGRYRISQSLPPRSSTRPGQIHFNMDVRVSDSSDKTHGSHEVWLGSLPSTPALRMAISSRSVSLWRDEGWEEVADLVPNQWQSIQLRIDMENHSVCGAVRMPSKELLFQRPLLGNWNGKLNYLVIQSQQDKQIDAPRWEFDNIGYQEAEIQGVLLPSATGQTTEELDVAAMRSRAEQALMELKALLTDGPFPMAYAMSEGTPHSVPMQLRGEPSQPGEMVPRGWIQTLGGGIPALDATGSGRKELAQWLTRPDNPLTARVMVNRIWQLHFGRGLVATPNDFGLRGLPPTHPELLDYLATDFIASGWSIKAMHRLIMLSSSYQQASKMKDVPGDAETWADAVTHGSHSQWYGRFARRRLTAEEIRDSILAVSGELESTPLQGHAFPSPLQWGFTQHAPFSAVYDHNHRSVYLMTQRLKRHPFLALFDGPDPNATTPDRLGTTVPTQALFFLNDPFVHAKSSAWAERLQSQVSDRAGQIDLAYQTAFSRNASSIEIAEATEFLSAYQNELRSEGREDDSHRLALDAFLRTLLGSNEFLYVD